MAENSLDINEEEKVTVPKGHYEILERTVQDQKQLLDRATEDVQFYKDVARQLVKTLYTLEEKIKK